MYTRRTPRMLEAPEGDPAAPSIKRSTGASSHSAFGLVEMGPLEWNTVDMGISAIAVDSWVESKTGAVADSCPVSGLRSSNRTCRFPASGSPIGFT